MGENQERCQAHCQKHGLFRVEEILAAVGIGRVWAESVRNALSLDICLGRKTRIEEISLTF